MIEIQRKPCWIISIGEKFTNKDEEKSFTRDIRSAKLYTDETSARKEAKLLIQSATELNSSLANEIKIWQLFVKEVAINPKEQLVQCKLCEELVMRKDRLNHLRKCFKQTDAKSRWPKDTIDNCFVD